ncbi:MAG TPA: FAD-dependent monooxygenase [Silvibacterium sp.]|nr:FAD-dependent monooxygenase [Silvibacterium sp.]
MSATVDALVVGGGPAGATLGVLLARAGQRITIIEKSAGAHDKMCGDFLSYEAIAYLRGIGIDPAAMGAAAISRVRLSARHAIGECALPFTGMSLTRRTLDERMLGCAEKGGATVLRGRRVQSLSRSGDVWVARFTDGDEVRAAISFVATGKHDLHGWPRGAGKQNDLVAFKMYFRLAEKRRAALAGYVELILFPDGYAGLELVEEGAANLCLVVRRSRLRSCGGQWPNVLEHVLSASPHLAGYLQGATALLEKPLALSSIPYGFVRSDARGEVWSVGDQAAVIPSFAGDGISIALHSAHVAAEEYLSGCGANAFQQRLYGQLRRQVSAATMLSRVMVAAPVLAQGIRLWPEALRPITRGTRVPQAKLIAAN